MKRLPQSSVSELVEQVRSIRDAAMMVEVSESKLTPYQKAQRNRRQTIATHTQNPAKQSIFYKHAVRAIFQKLRKDGSSFQNAAKGGQNISKWMMKRNGYASGQESGGIKLTGKGRKRNRMHAAEPASVRRKKEQSYDWIMGIQRRQAAKKQAIRRKSMSAG